VQAPDFVSYQSMVCPLFALLRLSLPNLAASYLSRLGVRFWQQGFTFTVSISQLKVCLADRVILSSFLFSEPLLFQTPFVSQE